jgi:hypothetical protein
MTLECPLIVSPSSSAVTLLLFHLRKRPQGKFFQLAFELEGPESSFQGFLFGRATNA